MTGFARPKTRRLNWMGLVPALVLPVLLLGGCMGPVGSDNPGHLGRKESHPMTPKAGELYLVQNLKDPGGKVFLFSSDTALAKCFNALKTEKDPASACNPGVAGTVEDGISVRTLDCENSQYAVCLVHAMEGEHVGLRGAILWDWLQPIAKSKKH